jgi:hypothetical protein
MAYVEACLSLELQTRPRCRPVSLSLSMDDRNSFIIQATDHTDEENNLLLNIEPCYCRNHTFLSILAFLLQLCLSLECSCVIYEGKQLKVLKVRHFIKEPIFSYIM